MKILLLSLFGIAVVSIFSGTYYQSYTTRIDLNNHPAPGNIFRVDDINLHIHCSGEGPISIILEAGLGESSLSWHPVFSDLARKNRVCTYDRAGMGWSDGINKQLSLDEISAHLHSLLQKASVFPPYVLIGHSRGGIYVRNYYQQYKDDVAGMVLIDSTHEQAGNRLYKFNQMAYLKQLLQIMVAVPLSKVGLVRLMGWADADRMPTPLPQGILEAKTAIQNTTQTAQAIVNEIRVMRRFLEEPSKPPSSLDNLPLAVLTSKENYFPKENQPSTDTEETQSLKLKWKMQEELAELSTNSKHIVAEKSGHFIMYDQPDLVIRTIQDIVDHVIKKMDATN